ncbi:phage major tail tube protein [Hydrogenovibrio sp. 3SP14C1]|uniref:phage major tail tube protein n=1 Tax=Hydrogenovibrio sp. 3SP14C1 TaxID=3038774 RepID=UPI0024159FEE|nr:phage major tail tube protein [Hydrogenovibrio sp. 3SP14C1]MDG4813046.1 phage major tail tube protein [Hydrogenovibrio sp. 3SP14C1]
MSTDREQAYVGLSLTVNGFGYVGSLIEFTEPVIKATTDDYRGGRIAPTEMTTGYEKVTSDFTLSRNDVNIEAARAIIGRDVVMTARASVDERGKKIAVEWAMYGSINSEDAQTIKAGDVVNKKYYVTVEKFVKSIDGVPAAAFDISIGELKFGTTDILAEVKAQLGL